MSGEEKQVAIVTGCGRTNGIGAAVARRLAEEGTAVAVMDLAQGRADGLGEDDELERLVADIRNSGGEAMACRGDVSSEADCANLVKQVIDGFGCISILVNNAAAPHGRDRNLIADVPLDAWNRQLEVNLTGHFLMIRAVAVPPRRRTDVVVRRHDQQALIGHGVLLLPLFRLKSGYVWKHEQGAWGSHSPGATSLSGLRAPQNL